MFRRPWQQLTVVLLPLVAAIAVLSWLTFTAFTAEVRAARQAQARNNFVRGVQALAEDVHRHRTAVDAAAAGDARFEPVEMWYRKDVDQQFDALDSLGVASPAEWFAARDRWEYLRAYFLFRTPAENIELHTRLNADLMALAAETAAVPPAPGLPLKTRLYLAAGSLLLGLLPGLGLAVALARRTSRHVNAVTEVCRGVPQGQYLARVPADGSDDLAVMAGAVNGTLDTVQGLAQARDERDQLDAALHGFLEDVHAVASGDLTHETPVDAGLPSALVEGFNHLIRQLRGLMGAAQTAALQANAAAKHLQALTDVLAQTGEAQARQAGQVAQAVEEIGSGLLARNAAATGTGLEQTLAAVQQGDAASRQTTQAVNGLRTRLEAAGRHIRNLADHTPDVAAFIRQLEDLADWSGTLAAQSGAASAQRLAARATEAARGLAGLSVLQRNLRQVGAGLDEAGREAVQATLLAVQTGQAALAAESSGHRLAVLNTEAAVAIRQQAQKTEALERSLRELSQQSQKAVRDVHQAGLAAESLTRLTDELRQAVESFRVPQERSGLSSVLSLDGTQPVEGAWAEHDSDPAHNGRHEGVEALSDK